ncbi:hypothetical protein NXC14_CH03431 [Rhizobium sp. NXC14]|uniref:hypothetical protein n=1 Tax=Rhizobium sp. NXC14 TaxID=1981173 RepID=UPI000A206E52|nr:hypothetical protein [Rhizobium sp. NXC14]ARO31332.1 hypothetical protein NXC14_CH03431 [Rhizobium sp. NXC14]
MEDWLNYLMSYAAFFMATVRSGVFLLDDRQFAAFALGVVGIILLLVGALVRTSLRCVNRPTSFARSTTNLRKLLRTSMWSVSGVWPVVKGPNGQVQTA